MIGWAFLVFAGTPSSDLDAAQKLLADFRPADALVHLERAHEAGPHAHEAYVELYEMLGIAYAYLERPTEAVRAFEKMLALDGARAISYTLSPKVTFLFEEARKLAKERGTTRLELTWPRDLRVSDWVPIDVEVLADPEGILASAELFFRLKGDHAEKRARFVLPRPGTHQTVELEPVASGAREDRTLEIHLVAYDERRNEVLLWESSQRPREVPLRYEPPDAWYARWWVWVIAGVAVGAGAGTSVYFATREPSATLRGTFEVER